MNAALDILMLVLVLAMGLATVRLLRGPSAPDRVLALDIMTIAGGALLVLAAMRYELAVLLDVALLVAIVAFFGTVALAQYLWRRSDP